MVNTMDLSKFETLELRVSSMLEKLTVLSGDKDRLETDLLETQEKLAATRQDLEAAEGLISEMKAEREAIVAKVDTILARLE